MSEGKPLVEDENSTLDKIIHYFPYFAVPIAILMLAAYFFNFHSGFGDQGDFGAFGDFFGGILNPMLSFLTILLLLRQLRYQRSELNSTAAELRATAEIHKETMKHNQAVDIYEKTYKEFDSAVANYHDSLSNSFLTISKDGYVYREALRLGDGVSKSDGTIYLTLETLEQKADVIRDILFSPKDQVLLDNLNIALNSTVRYATEIYFFAEEYQKLGVNNLLYLGRLERFHESLKNVERQIESLEIEDTVLPITSVLNAVIHHCKQTIMLANDTPNLD